MQILMLDVEGRLDKFIVSVKVRSFATAGVGERLLLDIHASARDNISQPVLTVTASHADAGEPPQLSLADNTASPGLLLCTSQKEQHLSYSVENGNHMCMMCSGACTAAYIFETPGLFSQQ